MNLLYTLLVGLIVGAVAKLLMPGKDPGGWIVTILLGIAGAWVGGFLASLLGLRVASVLGGLLVAIAGAVLLLFLYRLFIGRKRA